MPDEKNKKVFVLIFIFSVVINLPFLFQAFHIDDPLSIYLAKQIIQNPANPYDFELVNNGVLQKFYRFYANPPFNGYMLSLMIRLLGDHEMPLHLFHLAYTFFIGVFMFLISMKFLKDFKFAISSTILLLISPAVFVMNHTIMPDIPLLCFYLAAIYFFLEAEDRTYFYSISGIFAAMACLTRYTGLTLIPIFLFCSFLKPRYRVPMSLLATIIPLIAFEFWYHWSLDLYSSNYWAHIVSFETAQNRILRIGTHFLANIVYLGGSAIFPISLFFPAVMLNIKKSRILILISGLIAMYSAIFLYKNCAHTLAQAMLVFIFVFCIISFLIMAFGHLKIWFNHRSQNILLLFWIILLVCFNSFFLHTAVKYNLLEIPPLILIFTIIVKNLLHDRSIHFLALTIALTGVLAGFIAIGDTILADTYRDFAKKIYFLYKKENNQVYYTGHWGWEYYLKKLNAKPILVLGTNKLNKEDIIIVPSIPWPQPLPLNIRQRIKLLKRVDVNSRFPVRTMNGLAKAFFYANYNFPNYTGVLPYSFSSKAPVESFYILEVQ